MRNRGLFAGLLLAAMLVGPPCFADDARSVVSFDRPEAQPLANSVEVFGGLMSTRGLSSTILFRPDRHPTYDNYIAGLGYDRDFFSFWKVMRLGVEVGVADRFGHYVICCDTRIISSHLVHSGELWGGPRLRYEGLVLFNELRIAPSVTVGLSATTNSIGRERERALSQHGNAHLLFYFGPQVAFSLRDHENVELTLDLHHRSGAGRTLGRIQEGYEAQALGLRMRF